MNRYVTVRCPSCRSVSQIKADAIRTEVIYCPVCEEAEIEYFPELGRIVRETDRTSLRRQALVPVYSNSR
jgi:ssDNA-binding Zn-finger/Zn-ribbon topoisomerase 1